jgi:hypothetical protein
MRERSVRARTALTPAVDALPLLCSELPAGTPASQPVRVVQVFRRSLRRHLPGAAVAEHLSFRPVVLVSGEKCECRVGHGGGVGTALTPAPGCVVPAQQVPGGNPSGERLCMTPCAGLHSRTTPTCGAAQEAVNDCELSPAHLSTAPNSSARPRRLVLRMKCAGVKLGSAGWERVNTAAEPRLALQRVASWQPCPSAGAGGVGLQAVSASAPSGCRPRRASRFARRL